MLRFPMTSRRRLSGLVPLFTAALLTACGSVTDPQNPPPDDRVAALSVEPTDLTILPGSTRRLAATARAASGQIVADARITWSSGDAAVATVDAEGTVTARAAGTVTIAAVSGGRRAEARVRVQSAPAEAQPAPALISMLPAGRPEQGGQFTLTLTGTGFTALSEVRWNGRPRATQFVSATELRATIPAEDVATAGTALVTVETPAPGGGRSAALTFTVTARVAALEVRGTLALWVGESSALTVAAKDAAGAIVPNVTFEFASSAPAVAVDQRGVLTGQSIGRATITVRGGGREVQVAARTVATPTADLLHVGTGAEAGQLILTTPGVQPTSRTIATTGLQVRDVAVSPDGRRIAFTARALDGNVDIYAIGRDGTGLARLTTHPADDDQPSWSPDGQRVAFRSLRTGRSDIHLMAADGSGQELVTSGTYFGDPQFSRPIWSPDGSRVLFVRAEGSVASATGEILAWTRATGAVTTLVRDRDAALDEPTLSPDGRFLVVRRQVAGQAAALRVYDLLGGPQLLPTEYGAGRAPAWSPDGNALAFTAQDEIVVTTPGDPFRKTVAAGTNAVWATR